MPHDTPLTGRDAIPEGRREHQVSTHCIYIVTAHATRMSPLPTFDPGAGTRTERGLFEFEVGGGGGGAETKKNWGALCAGHVRS